ncbi:MAG: TonB-dependent receptor [Thermoanaerobaculia bacterium]|nr:TonB-dependent receptor [Thermoanaerobaculia bacterium]
MNRGSRIRKFGTAAAWMPLAVALLVSASAGPIAAQDAAAGATEPAGKTEEEITVTATLREQKLQEVPFSIAAPTEEVLTARGVDSIEGIAANVPGFIVQNLGPGQSQVAMRGVSAGQIVRDQPGVKEQVSVYLDDSVISTSLFTPDLDLWDVGRVEVLRAPQGTLFGSGSLAGTVRYISNPPAPGTTAADVELGIHAIDGGDLGFAAKVMVNRPIGETSAFRLAAYHNDIAGYIDAVQPDLSVRDDVNSGTRSGVRLSFLFAPNENLTITPRLLYQEVTTDGWNRVDTFNILGNPYTTTRPAVTLGEREQFTQIGEPFEDQFLLADLKLDYEFDGMTFTSITSYIDRDVQVVRDAGALTSSITGGSVGLPENVYTLDSPLDDSTTVQQWTQEVRLAGGDERLNWLVGAFYTEIQRDYAQNLLVSGFEDLSGIPTQGLRAPKDSLFWSDLSYDFSQLALFGEGTWRANDRFDLTVGARYYDFEESREQIFDGIFGNDNNGTLLVSQPGSADATGVVPRLLASYALNATTSLNAQISQGFRLGGINDPLNVPLCTPQDLATFGGQGVWKDETLWNYEIGTKSTILGGRGTFNVSGFYMDIEDLQATVTAGSCSSRVIFNVPKAHSQGIEFELSATPNANWDYSLSASYADSQLDSTLRASDGSVISGIQEGNRLPTVPELQAVAAATYQWQLNEAWLASITGTYQYVGERYTQIGDQGAGFGTVNLNSFGANTIGGPLTQGVFTFDPELPAYDLVNLRFVVSNGRYDLAAYVNNVTDEEALLALDQERGTRARVGYLTNQPRTFGVSVRVRVR